MRTDYSNLKRQLHSIPDFVELALKQKNLVSEYFKRPAYQQNDYIGWITRAKRQEIKEKRLRQMLDELEVGSVYMGMKRSSRKS